MAAALLAGACAGETTGPDASGAPMFAAGVSTRALDGALVGRWSRLVLVDAAAGLTASETRWTFFADGLVERRLVTSNLTLGLADQIVSLGTWTSGGGTVTIVLDDAPGTTIRLAYAVAAHPDGARLTLGGLAFERLAP